MTLQDHVMTQTGMTALQALANLSSIVADTGDLDAIRAFTPEDATTNPSLVLAALKQHPDLLPQALSKTADLTQLSVCEADDVADCLAVILTQKILDTVPGYVSMEVPARLSFDTEATVKHAHFMLSMLRRLGADTSRVLIKVAATWEGIAAVKILEAAGIKCNVTLVFCLSQAVQAAQAGAFLISPFVGRVYDWHIRNKLYAPEEAEPDPGVELVQMIRSYFAQNDIQTIIMAASFRTTSQVLALAGTDKLTISPDLLKKLDACDAPRKLAAKDPFEPSHVFGALDVTQAGFRHALNEDRMASHLLNDGIRRFEKDAKKLNAIIMAELQQ